MYKKEFIHCVRFWLGIAGSFFIFVLFPTSSASAAAPTITSVSPTTGIIGASVTIYGTGFSSSSLVIFGQGAVLPDVVYSDSQLKFTVPTEIIPQCAFNNPPCQYTPYSPPPAIYSVSVTDFSFSQTSNVVNFTLVPKAVITNISTTYGQIGTQVTIYGYGFSATADAVTFDSASGQGVIVQISNSTSVVSFVIPQQVVARCSVTLPATCPPQAFAPAPGTYTIGVAPDFNFNQLSNVVSFTLASGSITPPGPVITSISPTSGTVGTQVTVKGTGFSPNFNSFDFGIGLALPRLVGTDLVFNVPSLLVQRCVVFSNPPCTPTAAVQMIPGTYSIADAIDANTISNRVQFTVNPIPVPTSTPPVQYATTTQVEATTNLNVRSDPSLSAPILGVEPKGSIGAITDGPVNADGHDWLQVAWPPISTSTPGLIGWSAEDYLVYPSNSPCTITIGDKVDVVSGGQSLTLYLRASPSASSSVVGGELDGMEGKIVDGPIIANLYSWWKLKFADGVVGWAIEANFVDVGCINYNYNPPPPPQAPTVTFITPVNGATISGQVPVTVSVKTSFTVIGVDFYRDGIFLGTVSSTPYTINWDATQVYNGSHSLKAHARTAEGVAGETTITVNVTGGLFNPIVTFINPLAWATVSGTVPIVVSATSSFPITQVNFYLDGTLLGTAKSAPYTINWDSTKVYNGSHVLSATAISAGGSGYATIVVNVTGAIPPPQPQTITVTFITPLTGATVSGQVPITVSVSSSDPIIGVRFYADSVLIGSASSSPYTTTWNASLVLNGWHTLSAEARTSRASGSRSITVNVTGGLSLPVVSFTTPLNGATVSGQVPVNVSVVSGNPPATGVDFYMDGSLLGSVASPPYTVNWDATKAYNGSHTLTATARTTMPNISGSASINVNVTGGIPPPSIVVSFTTPQNATTVFGLVPVSVTVSSTVSISEVDIYNNGTLLGAITNPPYSLTWDATNEIPGNHTLTATAKATNGGSVSASITVNVIPVPIFKAGDRIIVQTDGNTGLNVRSGPSVNYSIIGTEANGSYGTVLINIPVFADTYNWWQIKYDNGITGWSVESYLVKAQ